MSISHSLNNAISGLNATSRLAEVVSSNVSNSLTEGYARRSLELSSVSVGGRGAGVGVGSVFRHVDRGILADRRLADAALNGAETVVSVLGRVEDIIGSPGSGQSISDFIVQVEAAFIDAGSNPSSDVALSTLNNSLRSLTDRLNIASDEIQRMRLDADQSIEEQVERLNLNLQQVEQLNSDIFKIGTTGGDPSVLMDERQRLVDQISEMVPVREMDRGSGRIALMTPAGEMLIDGRAKSFGFVANTFVTPDLTLSSGALSGVTFDGVPLASDGVGRLAGGTLGAAFQARDEDLVVAQESLDRIAADLTLRFQDPTVDPSLATGDPGLFTDGGAAFDSADTVGLAGRITLNANVDPEQGGLPSRLRDGLYAATIGPVGNSGILQSYASALGATSTTSSDPVQRSAAGRAAMLESGLGQQRLDYEAELGFATARWSTLKEAEAAGGVDTDFEMQMLLRVEQAYSANARLIQTVESMLQTLMEL
ncbi:MAG: flagellar hook-associated protein FlgK [Pseudomonadota bacterium]